MKYSYIVLIAVAFVSFLLMQKSSDDVVQNVTSISEQVTALPYEKENAKQTSPLIPQPAPKPVNKNFTAVFKGDGMCVVFDVQKNSVVGNGHYNIFSEQGHGPCVLSKVTQNGVVVQTVATVLSLDPLTKTVTSNTTDSLAVAKVQLVLAHEGYIQKEDISGNYLSKTVSAMKAFQAAHQLEVTGSAGPQTRTLINTLLSTKISNPLSCPWSCGYIQ